MLVVHASTLNKTYLFIYLFIYTYSVTVNVMEIENKTYSI